MLFIRNLPKLIGKWYDRRKDEPLIMGDFCWNLRVFFRNQRAYITL
jgi:hypothetical protein